RGGVGGGRCGGGFWWASSPAPASCGRRDRREGALSSPRPQGENYLFLGWPRQTRRESVPDGELVERDFVVRLVECVVDDPGRDNVDHCLRGIGRDRDDLLHEVQVKRRPAA